MKTWFGSDTIDSSVARWDGAAGRRPAPCSRSCVPVMLVLDSSVRCCDGPSDRSPAVAGWVGSDGPAAMRACTTAIERSVTGGAALLRLPACVWGGRMLFSATDADDGPLCSCLHRGPHHGRELPTPPPQRAIAGGMRLMRHHRLRLAVAPVAASVRVVKTARPRSAAACSTPDHRCRLQALPHWPGLGQHCVPVVR